MCVSPCGLGSISQGSVIEEEGRDEEHKTVLLDITLSGQGTADTTLQSRTVQIIDLSSQWFSLEHVQCHLTL